MTIAPRDAGLGYILAALCLLPQGVVSRGRAPHASRAGQKPALSQSASASKPAAALTPQPNPALREYQNRLGVVWKADDWNLDAGHALDTRGGRERAIPGSQKIHYGADCVVLDSRYTRRADGPAKSDTRFADTTARLLRFRTRKDSPALLLIERETTLKQEIEGADGPSPNLQMLAVEGKPSRPVRAAYGTGSSPPRPGSAPEAVLQPGDYAVLNAGAQSAVAVFVLRSELAMRGSSPTLPLHTRVAGAAMRLGYHFPIQVLPLETRFRQTFLIARALPNHQEEATFARVQRAFGLDNDPPAYTAAPEWGTIASARYPLDIAAKENAAVVAITQTDLPCDLPVRVTGLQAHWTAFLVELPVGMTSVPLAPGALPSRPLSVVEGVGYAAVDVGGQAHRLFLGHPVICDRHDVEITVTAWNAAGLTARLRNGSGQALAVNARVHPRLGFGRQAVRIPARSSVTVQLSWR